MHMVSLRVRYGLRWHSWQAISNESQTSSIWLVKVPSKPISHENGYHMHFLARNNLKFKFHNKETHNWNIATSAANHRVRYGVRSELSLTLKHNRGVREKQCIYSETWPKGILWLGGCPIFRDSSCSLQLHKVYIYVHRWCLETLFDHYYKHSDNDYIASILSQLLYIVSMSRMVVDRWDIMFPGCPSNIMPLIAPTSYPTYLIDRLELNIDTGTSV